MINQIDIEKESRKAISNTDVYTGIKYCYAMENYNKEAGFKAISNKLNEVIDAVNDLEEQMKQLKDGESSEH